MYLMLFLIAFFICLAAYTMIIHNKAMPNQQIVDETWMKTDILLKRRISLVPHLLEAAKGYMQYEKEVITTLNNLRSHIRQYGSTQNHIKGRIEAEWALSEALIKLLTAAEKYPDLKANVNFLNCQQRLVGLEEELQKTLMTHDDAAKNINALIRFFPNHLLLKIFGVQKLYYLKPIIAELK